MSVSPEGAALEQICMWRIGRKLCGNPALWHVRVGESVAGMGCEKHIRKWLRSPDLDFHQVDHVCGLPDAIWHRSTQIDPPNGYCSIDWGGGLTELIDKNHLVNDIRREAVNA